MMLYKYKVHKITDKIGDNLADLKKKNDIWIPDMLRGDI